VRRGADQSPLCAIAGAAATSFFLFKEISMARYLQALFVLAVAIALGVGVVGCYSSSAPEKDKMGKDKMGGGMMGSDKMGGDKMGSDKMTGDKMADDKMGTDKMGKDKMATDKK
jgi:pentapeptide MXKDX repeat protein